MVVVTKIDICPPQILQETLRQLMLILKSPGARKIPILIKTKEECINTAVRLLEDPFHRPKIRADRYDVSIDRLDSVHEPADMSHFSSVQRDRGMSGSCPDLSQHLTTSRPLRCSRAF